MNYDGDGQCAARVTVRERGGIAPQADADAVNFATAGRGVQGRVVNLPSPLPSPKMGEGVRAAQQPDFKNKDHEFIMVL